MGRGQAAGHRFRCRQHQGRTAAGHQPDGLRPGQLADFVGPGSGGVDHHRGLPLASGGAHLPVEAIVVQHLHGSVAHHRTAMLAHAFQKALVDGMHIQIAGTGLVHRIHHLLGAQHRHHRTGLGRGEAVMAQAQAGQHGQVGGEFGFLTGGGHHQCAARCHQRMLGKPGGRVQKKVAAAQRECPHLG